MDMSYGKGYIIWAQQGARKIVNIFFSEKPHHDYVYIGGRFSYECRYWVIIYFWEYSVNLFVKSYSQIDGKY